MKTKNKEQGNAFATMLFLLGCIGLFSVIVLDKIYWDKNILAEGLPDFSISYLMRSILIFSFIIAIVWSLIGSKRPKLILDEGIGFPLERLIIFGVLSVSVIILFLFIVEPSVFNVFSWEDGPIEWASAILLFSSFIIVSSAFFKSYNVVNITRVTQLSLVVLALVFFLMTMEEVSWFQRVLEFKTPKVFIGNSQNEMNFHNYATNYVENIYYFGIFLFLVVLPFIRFLYPYVSENNYLRLFVGRPYIGIIGSVACAYNFDMWNIIFTQMAFFGSVVILFVFAVFSRNRNDRFIIVFTIFLIVTTQILFLNNGANFVRIWEVTEYKEFLIPLVLFIYSLDIFRTLTKPF